MARKDGFSLEKFISLVDKLRYPSSVPDTASEKRPVIQRQETILGQDIFTASVPIYDEVGEGQYILRRQKWETGFGRRIQPIPPQAPPSWRGMLGRPNSRRARQDRR